jgi:hypothetical protein
VLFPPAPDGKLNATATKNGEPEPISLQASADVRDTVSGLFVFRALTLKEGTPVCMEAFGGRKIWKVTGKVGKRESIETPMGRFESVRIDTEAVRTDDAKVKRAAHVWISDDARRLPLVTIGEVRGKTIRATLVGTSGARGRVTQRK